MNVPLIKAVWLVWIPIVLILFRAIGPRRAVLVGFLGGELFLPDYQTVLGPPWFPFVAYKWNLTGLALLVGVLAFDRQTLVRFRPGWLDLPMAAFTLAPLIGLVTGVPGSAGDIADLMVLRGLAWVVPYLMGRLYFGRADGPATVGVALVISGLIYIPFCLYEEFAGPPCYLAGLIYGTPYNVGMVDRLGGWRPEVFLGNGLTVASWMALTTVMAAWLWLGGAWRLRKGPAWLPTLALLAATLSCRGVYGYILLAIGFATLAATRLFRTRAIFVILIAVPFVYMVARASGLWDGGSLVEAARFMGREGTIAFRLHAEDEIIGKVLGRNPVFGSGNYIWHGDFNQWPDGNWLHVLWMGGLVGLTLQLTAIYVLPAGLALSIPARRPDARQALSPAWGLAAWVVLQMIDAMHNTSYLTPIALIGGSLVGMFLASHGVGFEASTDARDRRRARGAAPPGSSAADAERMARPSAASGHVTYRLGDIKPKAARRAGDGLGTASFAFALACVFYVFGHAKVDGQEVATFVGGLGSALLFAAVGAVAVASPRRSLPRVAALAVAFGTLGITFNLALHASNRPFWSGDILQGMALSGLVVAAWRRATGGGPWAYAVLAALAASWWVFEPFARSFPGSQYLFESGSGDLSLFPMLPWLTLSAVGAWLVESSVTGRVALALVLGSLAVMGWSLGPVKFPLSPVYAMAGGSLASAAFALAGLCRRWAPVRSASDWLGRRWLVFFYLHLGIATVLGRAGLTWPVAAWVALALLSIGATWVVSWSLEKLRAPFRQPATWVALFAAMLAVGLWPGVPAIAVVGIAGGIGLMFAARFEDLAALILGPKLDDIVPIKVAAWPRHLGKVLLVVAALAAPELVARLPAPFGQAPRVEPRASANATGGDSAP
jgi:hypothetical protein